MAVQSDQEQQSINMNMQNLAQAPAYDDDTMEIDLVALFYRLLEKIHWIIITAIIFAVFSAVYVTKLTVPMYKATAKIYIVGSDTTISLSDLQIGSNLAADYQEVFKNWHVHELVKERLQLNYTNTELSKMISVNNPSNTHLLYVNATSTDPNEAKLIADTYAQVSREFIATKMDMREPNIFEEAKLPTTPVSPNKVKTIVIGFILGSFLAAAIVILRFVFDDRILTSEDVNKVDNLVLLGAIPLQNSKKKHRLLNNGTEDDDDE